MTNYINYTVANVSSFAGAYDYASTVLQQGSGVFSPDLFAMLVLFGIFMVFTGISIKYNQERAVLYGSFMTVIASSLMVSGGLLSPLWSVLPLSIFLVALFIWGAKS